VDSSGNSRKEIRNNKGVSNSRDANNSTIIRRDINSSRDAETLWTPRNHKFLQKSEKTLS
jgi:hypothetical protein